MATAQEIMDDMWNARRAIYGLPPLGPAPDLRRPVYMFECPWCSPPLLKWPQPLFASNVA